MIKKIKNKLTLKTYEHLILGFWITLLCFLVSEIIIFICLINITNVNYIACGWSMFVIYILQIIIGAFQYFCLINRDELIRRNSVVRYYFDKDPFIYDEETFRYELSKIRKRNGNGTIISIGVKGLTHETVSAYSSAAIKTVNNLLNDSIKSHFYHDRHMLYCFADDNSFLLYRDIGGDEEFYREIKDIINDVNLKIKLSNHIPYVTILIGVYESLNKDKDSEIIARCKITRKFNESFRPNGDLMFFNEEMLRVSQLKDDLSYELTSALKNNELEVYYQPKYSLKNNKFEGAEALIRWNHPKRGLIPPSTFIPYAEQNGRIIELDRYVFEHVLKDMSEIIEKDGRLLKVSINLSRASINDPKLIDFMNDTINKYHVPPQYVQVELTESISAKDLTFTSYIIRKIRSLGIDTAIDDFGMGYSSVSSLKEIPFSTMKIDKSMIDDIEVDKIARKMTKTIIELGHILDMEVVAEGVENEKQVEILTSLNLDTIQGYYYSKPLNKNDLQDFLLYNKFEHIDEELKRRQEHEYIIQKKKGEHKKL